MTAQHLKHLETRKIAVEDAEIFARIGGTGPPLLLLHGFPQTHLCWSRIVPRLAEHFTLVLADLTGYGESRGPVAEEGAANYSKRTVARHMASLMEAVGHERFHIAGHDRGARVAYRLALDHPKCVERLAVLSILPTFAMWRRLGDVEKAMDTFHWFLLAQKPPIPHDLLLGAAANHVRNTIASWTKSGTLEAFAADELEAYTEAYSRVEVIAAVCAEYRAGWTTDRKLDESDVSAGHKIRCPTLVLWGLDEYSRDEMLAAWREIADNITPAPIDSGHFLIEEKPDETVASLVEFFAPDVERPQAARKR
jgi:haloacetate dehalogenase